MTKKQIEDYNRMYGALLTIAKDYMSVGKLRKEGEKIYGIDYEEVLEMAYENIQELAKAAVKNVKQIKQNNETI